MDCTPIHKHGGSCQTQTSRPFDQPAYGDKHALATPPPHPFGRRTHLAPLRRLRYDRAALGWETLEPGLTRLEWNRRNRWCQGSILSLFPERRQQRARCACLRNRDTLTSRLFPPRSFSLLVQPSYQPSTYAPRTHITR